MSADSASKQIQFQKVLDYVVGNQAAWIANIGLQVGLFRAVADAGGSGITETALSEKLGYKLAPSRGGVVVFADADPAGVGGHVVHAVGDRLPSSPMKSCTLTSPGRPLAATRRPPFWYRPTSSFFSVSTDTTGCPVSRGALTCAAR